MMAARPLSALSLCRDVWRWLVLGWCWAGASLSSLAQFKLEDRLEPGTAAVCRLVLCSAPSVPQPGFTITEKAPTRAFS